MHPTAQDHPSRRPRPRCDHRAPGPRRRRRTVADEALRAVVELACLAPSIHNTQPWTWRLRDGLLELHADATRRLPAADPTSRSLVISCGAALHHARVAARALGWEARRRAAARGRGRFAACDAASGAGDAVPSAQPRTCAAWRSAARTVAGSRRGRSRTRRLERLAEAAREEGADALGMLDVTERFAVELLTSRAQGCRHAIRACARSSRPGSTRGGATASSRSCCPSGRTGLQVPRRRLGGLRPGRRRHRRADRAGRSHRRPRGVAADRRGAERPLAQRHPRRPVRGAARPGGRGGRDPSRAAAPGARQRSVPAAPGAARLAAISRSEVPHTPRRTLAEVLAEDGAAPTQTPPSGREEAAASHRERLDLDEQRALARRPGGRMVPTWLVDGVQRPGPPRTRTLQPDWWNSSTSSSSKATRWPAR